jgi:hypothetical protein
MDERWSDLVDAEPLFLAILWPHRLWTAERLLWHGVGMLVFAVLLELVFAGVGYMWRAMSWALAQRSTAEELA